MSRQPTKAPANHLRAWRERAGLTQDQLAEKVGTAGNVIGLLESGERRLSDKWLYRLAPHLGTKPGMILDHHPNDLDTAILEVWASVPDERKAEGRAMLEILARKRA